MHQASYGEIVDALRSVAKGGIPSETASRAAVELALVAEGGELTPRGRRLVEDGILRRDDAAIRRVMREAIDEHPAVRPISEGQWGLELTRDQVSDVLAYAYPDARKWSAQDFTRYLETLTAVGIAAFNRRRPTVRILTGAPPVQNRGLSGLVSPKTPFRNKRLLAVTIREATTRIWWFDPHLTRRALEFVYDEATLDRVKDIRLLSVGRSEVTAATKDDCERIITELGERNVKIEWRTIVEPSAAGEKHDRWLRIDDQWWNVPPFSAVMTGKYSSLLEEKGQPPFEEWWAGGVDLRRV